MAGAGITQMQGVEPWMIEAFNGLSHGNDLDLAPFLSCISRDVSLPDTEAICRCHFLRRDGNDRPAVDRLAAKVAAQAIQYCIPRTRLEEVRTEVAETGRFEKAARLQEEARSLFTDIDTSGEGGEMLLYLLLESELGLPQLLCKMPLKTSSRVHFHGVDGVHGSLEKDGRLGLYWCESKLHKKVSTATRECFESLAPFLLDEGSKASKRDLLLVRDHLDVGDPKLADALKQYLDDDTIESTLRVVKGASLIGFSLDEYPNPFEADGQSVVKEVSEQVQKWFDAIEKRIKHHKLDSFEIEVFCLPMPDVEAFRKAIKAHLHL
jgi:hypothetical protein